MLERKLNPQMMKFIIMSRQSKESCLLGPSRSSVGLSDRIQQCWKTTAFISSPLKDQIAPCQQESLTFHVSRPKNQAKHNFIGCGGNCRFSF